MASIAALTDASESNLMANREEAAGDVLQNESQSRYIHPAAISLKVPVPKRAVIFVMSATSMNKDHEDWDMAIVKEGYLFVKRPPGHKWNKFRAWHKKYFVLKDSGQECGPELLMYSSHREAKSNHCPAFRHLVRETVHLGMTSESHRFRNVLVVVMGGKSPLLLANEDEMTARLWMQALDLTSQQNEASRRTRTSKWSSSSRATGSAVSTTSMPQCGSLDSDSSACSCAATRRESQTLLVTPAATSHPYCHHHEENYDVGSIVERFAVSALPTESADHAGLKGSLQLCIFRIHIGFRRVGDDNCSVMWPVSGIRLYRLDFPTANEKKSKSVVVTIEVGRRCPTGEGVFSFVTDQGVEIIREIKKAVANLSMIRSSRDASSSSHSRRSKRKSCCHQSRDPASRSRSATLEGHESKVNYASVFLSSRTTDAFASSSIKPDEGYINDDLLQ